MNLRFEGDLSLWQAALLALIAAVAIWALYRRDARHGGQTAGWILPLLRAAAVALLILMLTGPVLRGKVQVGDVSRVLVFLDQSKSMSLTDVTMARHRKLLNCVALGLLPQEAIPQQLQAAVADARQLRAAAQAAVGRRDTQSAGAAAGAGSGPPGGETDDGFAESRASDAAQQLAAAAAALAERLQQLGDNEMSDEIRAFARARATDERSGEEQGSGPNADLWLPQAKAWQKTLEERFQAEVAKRADAAGPELAEALKKLDAASRWWRMRRGLLETPGVVEEIGEQHTVQLLAFSGEGERPVRSLWSPDGPQPMTKALPSDPPKGPATDLTAALQNGLDQIKPQGRLLAVIASDGRHNREDTQAPQPLQLAALLGARGVPVYTVGVGAANPPRDLAVLAVQNPEAVFADDRVKGRLLIKDNWEPGQPLQIAIRVEDKVAWQQTLRTTGAGPRNVEFDFSIKKLVADRLAADARRAQAVSLPLKMKVQIEPLQGEARDDNNHRDTHLRVVTRRRKLLLIDSRPRWEYRYLKNLFDRDEQWEVNDLLLEYEDDEDTGAEQTSLPRGNQRHRFPTTRDALFAYDLIFLGDVPRGVFTERELQWITQFVASRGGGLMLIDGRRGDLRSFADSALGSLLPVKWTGPHADGFHATGLELTSTGKSTAALALQSGDGDQQMPAWSQLPPPHWVAPAEALPGCETLLAARDKNRTSPVLVVRRFGAGRVLYAAIDESWRWRYEVADLHHQRYWTQLAHWIMESPFAVHGKHVSIDTGGFTFERNAAPQIRVRLRDERGQPVHRTKARVLLQHDGQTVARVELKNDKNASGVLRGVAPQLRRPGLYRLRVQADGFRDEQLDAQAELLVQGEPTGEMNVLSCNEPLLQEIAARTNGRYLREEDLHQLPQLLAPYSDGRVEEREFELWRSWFWFVPLVLLFSAEWTIRKRSGLM